MKLKKCECPFWIFFCLSSMLILLNTLAHGDQWRELRTRHAIVYFNNEAETFAKTASKAVEDYYYDISSDLGIPAKDRWPIGERVNIYIHDNQQEYLSASAQGEWSNGVAIGHRKIITTYPQAAGFFDTLLPHELTHIIFYYYVKDMQVPQWFQEGVAMYQEKAKRYGAHNDVKKAIKDGRFISLKKLSGYALRPTSTNDDVVLYYAESASVVSFIIDQEGPFKFQKFCRTLKEKRSFEKALSTTYRKFVTLDELNKAWVEYLKRI